MQQPGEKPGARGKGGYSTPYLGARPRPAGGASGVAHLKLRKEPERGGQTPPEPHPPTFRSSDESADAGGDQE